MLKRLLRYTRSFFNFSHAEAKGFLGLSFLLGILAIGFLIYDQIPSNGYTSFHQDKYVLDSLVAMMEKQQLAAPEDSSVKYPASGRRDTDKVVTFFTFNPNQLPADSLLLLGTPASLAQRIQNYREKGGRFRKKEDLLKIYGFPDSLYRALEPYLRLPPATAGKEVKKEIPAEEGREVSKLASTFDINQADSLQLQQVRGIGPVLSSRIIRFRDKLGGFVRMEQLFEVYGLDSLVVQKLAEKAYVQKNFTPDQIQLNAASREQLASHPYINSQQAGLIVAYRNEHGPFQKVNDLRKIHTLSPNLIDKIAPYIRLDE